MSNTFEEGEERELFSLYPYAGMHIERSLVALIEEGHLQEDALFRLASVGYNEIDPETGDRLTWTIVRDLIDNARDPSKLRDDTTTLLAGDMPDAIIDWLPDLNERVRASFDDMYYSVGNLAAVIRERGFANTVRDEEKRSISRGVAKGLWRAIINRHHPEWLSNPEAYYATRISFGTAYYNVKPRTMQSRIVSRAVFSDPLVYETYTEARTTGVRGIADKGIESLRLLLSEEHPELM